MPARRIVSLVTAALVAFAPRVGAQSAAAPAPAPSGEWRVVRDPFADLWFHTMGLVGDQGFGALPLYDAAHAQRVRRSRLGRGIRVGFDDDARTLRARVAGDSALELLHFVPMYFVGVPPHVALAALREAAEPLAGAPASHDRAHVAARAIASALGSARERAVLVTVVRAAADEWRNGAVTTGGALAGEAAVPVAALQRDWDERFAPLLASRLRASGLTRGVIVVSPALAAEGRLARAAEWGVVVAVGAQPGAGDDAPLLSAVRELSYPVLDRVLAESAPDGGRIAAARRRDAAAVRAGEMLLAGDPELAARYRALFAAALGGPPTSFDRLFPLDPTSERTLRDALASTR